MTRPSGLAEEKKKKEREIDELTAIVGQYSVENTWLKKNIKNLVGYCQRLEAVDKEYRELNITK